MNGIDIIYYDQDCNMKFISEHQQLCSDCYNNSKKDPIYPYITLATDPSWIIMEYISYDNISEIYIKCSHDKQYDHTDYNDKQYEEVYDHTDYNDKQYEEVYDHTDYNDKQYEEVYDYVYYLDKILG